MKILEFQKALSYNRIQKDDLGTGDTKVFYNMIFVGKFCVYEYDALNQHKFTIF